MRSLTARPLMMMGAFWATLLWIPGLSAQELIIEEMIVTAQKREQNLQDVPIAITAVDSQFLDDAGIDDMIELQQFVPGLDVLTDQSVAQANFRVRGVGTAGNSLSVESSVGIYVDGVYRSRQSSAIGDLVDMQRIEVLKGPQGTLFGKNTSAGAIQLLSVAPNPMETEGYLEVKGGNLDYRNVNGAINIPFFDKQAAFRLSAGWTDRDGYVDNLVTGTKLNNRDRFQFRGQLLVVPNEQVSIRVIGDYSKIEERCCAASNWYDGPADTLPAFLGARGIPGLVRPPNATYFYSIDSLGGQVVLADNFDDDDTATDIDPRASVKESGISMEINWEFADHQLTSITAYRSYEAANAVDADFTSLPTLIAQGNESDQDTFSQELRLTNLVGERLTYVVGAYYFQQDLDDHFTVRIGPTGNLLFAGSLPPFAAPPTGTTLATLDAFGQFEPAIPAGAICAGLVDPRLVVLCPLPAFPAGQGSDNFSKQEQESWAVFGQVDFDVTDSLIATVGLRYTDETKKMDVDFTETIPTPAFAALTPLSPLVPNVEGAKLTDDEITGTAKLSYFWTDSIMTYISFGHGYKSGGTNIDRVDPATGAPILFDPETTDSWEIGFKGDLLDGRVRINAAAHMTDVNDFQENSFVGTGFVLQNAGKIESRGGELEVFTLPAQWLSLAGGVAYVDAEYASFVGGACILTPLLSSPDLDQPGFPVVCDNTGNTVPNTPEWSLYGSARVSSYIGEGMMGYGQLDVSWRDKTVAGNGNDPNREVPSITLVNLHLGLRINERYDVTVWGKNIFDEDYHGGSFAAVIREGSISAYLTEPRTWGVTLRAEM